MRRLVRSSLILLSLALIALAGPVATSADTAVSHDGRYGEHYLADSEEYPGARCSRDDSTGMESVRVRDPFVFARNRSPDRVDSQWVAWKFRVKAQTLSEGSWTTVATSALQKRMATDAQVANFSRMTKSFVLPIEAGYLRVVVVMLWYGSDGTTVVGRAVHRVDWYAFEGHPSFEGRCPGGIF